MSKHPSNPTLVIGLGAFGRAVIDELERDQSTPLITNGALRGFGSEPVERIQNLETIRVAVGPDDEAPWGAIHVEDDPESATRLIRTEVSSRARWLLDLSHYLESTRATDDRGPRLDVFIVGALREPGVAALVAPLVQNLSVGLRDEFRPILRRGDGALAVCPLLTISRGEANPDIHAAVEALNAQSGEKDIGRRPQARVYLVEDQSGKYVVSRAELVRSFAAFLHLLLFSKLRDAGGVRTMVERNEGDSGGPFATFACATLEVDVPALQQICAVKLARELLREFREGSEPVLTEIAGEAHPLVPEPIALEEELWKEGSVGTLEVHLEPPSLPVPDIHLMDSPEDITERKFGAVYRAQISHRIAQFRDEVERFNMDRLAQGIERNGSALVDQLHAQMMARVRKQISSAPRGHMRALEFVRYAATNAEGRADSAEHAITSPNLHKFPPPPLDSGLDAIHEATFSRPRRLPFRMRFFGTLLFIMAWAGWAGLIGHALTIGGYGDFVGWPSITLSGAFAASGLYYVLWRHMKRHHNWVLEARNSLDQRLKRYMRTDVVAYFRRRLVYTRDLWVYRVYRRIADSLNALVEQLEGTRAACAEADRILAAREAELLEDLVGSSRTGILFRGMLLPETVDACYRAVRPPELASQAAEFLVRGVEDPDSDPLEAPFADPDRLLAFSNALLKPISTTSPFAAEGANPLRRAVDVGVQQFLTQLALKLSVPLELISTVVKDVPAAGRIAVVPPEAESVVKKTLAEENLGGGKWQVTADSGDPCRIHLILERGGLPLSGLALLKPESTS